MPRGSSVRRSAEPTPGGLPPIGPACGDLAGEYPCPIVVGLRGVPICLAAAAPTLGDALVFDGAEWCPSAPGGDLGGDFITTTVTGWFGVPLCAGSAAPALGDAMIFDGAEWCPSVLPGPGGLPVCAAAATPETGAIFYWTGTEWCPTVQWHLDDAVASRMFLDNSSTSVSFEQAQDPSAAGAQWSIRAQQGFAGFDGGSLTLGGGDPGTPGVNFAGDTRVELGARVATAVKGAPTSAFMTWNQAGVPFLTLLRGAQDALPAGRQGTGLIANGGVGVGDFFLATVDGDLFLDSTGVGRNTSLSTSSGAIQFLNGSATQMLNSFINVTSISPTTIGTLLRQDVGNAASWTTTFQGTLTSGVVFQQAQMAVGAGAPMSFRAARGAAGSPGGTLTIGGGNGGTLGANAPGNTRINLGTAVTNQSAQFQLVSEAGGVIGEMFSTSTARFLIRNGAAAATSLDLSALSTAPVRLIVGSGTKISAENLGASFFGAGSFGTGNGVISILNSTTNPTTNPVGGGILYETGGALTHRGSAGTVTTIAPA